MAITVFVISASYSHIIELFPTGGGGYLVATKLLGPKVGLVSGSALIVDYMLTITISVASAGDQIFSFLPISTHGFKLAIEFGLIFFLIYLNLRGTKETVLFLLPIFLLFVVAHIFAIGLGILPKAAEVPLVASTTYQKTIGDIQGLGLWATLFIVLHAYSLGGGTYTGIEAVSNGLQALREPRVETGKKTMLYMATSLAFTASGLLLCYLLNQVSHETGKTLNASLFAKVYGGFFSPELAYVLVIITLDHRSSHPVSRGPGRLHRWAASAFEYGDRLLGASSLFSFKRQLGYPTWRLVHGSGLPRFSLIYRR